MPEITYPASQGKASASVCNSIQPVNTEVQRIGIICLRGGRLAACVQHFLPTNHILIIGLPSDTPNTGTRAADGSHHVSMEPPTSIQCQQLKLTFQRTIRRSNTEIVGSRDGRVSGYSCASVFPRTGQGLARGSPPAIKMTLPGQPTEERVRRAHSEHIATTNRDASVRHSVKIRRNCSNSSSTSATLYGGAETAGQTACNTAPAVFTLRTRHKHHSAEEWKPIPR